VAGVETETVQYFITQGPWALVFVWLLYAYRKEAHEREHDAQDREKRLNKLVNEQTKVLSEFSEKYDIIVTKLDGIEQRLPPNR
jgi:hypothetical protein